MAAPIAPDEYEDWKVHPVTRMYFNHLETLKDTIKDDWAAGIFTAESAEGTAQKNAVALGQIQLINDLINIDEESL